MSVVTLNVVTLDTAIKYLGADSVKIHDFLLRNLIDCDVLDGEHFLDEDQFMSLERLVYKNNLQSKGEGTISVYDLQSFCLNRGYIESERIFNDYLNNGLFNSYKVTHPFTGKIEYKSRVLSAITNSTSRGGVVTVKYEGYTKGAIIKELGVSNAKFLDLVGKLKITPRLFSSVPIYTKDQYLSIKKLDKMVKSFSRTRKEYSINDVVFLHEGKEYINKDNVRLYTKVKYSTLVYLTNLGAIKYKDIVFKGTIVTVASKTDLDLLKECLNRGYKPAVVALVLNGFLTLKELGYYTFSKDVVNVLKDLGIPQNKVKTLLDDVIQPDLIVHGVKLYNKPKMYDFIQRYVRGTYLDKNVSTDYISTSKLASLVGKTSKNIKSYASKYLTGEEDILRIGNEIYLKLNSYLSLQEDESVLERLNLEENQCKKSVNLA